MVNHPGGGRAVFDLFDKLVFKGNTILTATYDDQLASLIQRTSTIADGEIVIEVIQDSGSAKIVVDLGLAT